MSYFPTIGLEIHAELCTNSKMFCGCRNDPDHTEPNTLICPVCMAHPGTLPVINQEAVLQVLRVGAAVGGKIANFTEFDRKNYFYPDIPKGYQISQYQYPLVEGGEIGPVAITRIHLEEDTARSAHSDTFSAVDFNRAGVPLMELVTEPVIHESQTAVSFARDLRLCLIYLGASHANLEKGEMRVEANISLAKDGDPLGTKVEVKNLNSFRAVEQAIAFEIKRQTEVLTSGKQVVQETRGWDENKQKTFSQRVKENSHDYRYFPEPDLPKLYVKELVAEDPKTLRIESRTLPWVLRREYTDSGLAVHVAELLVNNIELQTFYSAVATHIENKDELQLATNYITSDLWGLVTASSYNGKSLTTLDPREFATLIILITDKKVSSRGAKNILESWLQSGGNPEEIAKKIGALQISDADALEVMIQQVIEENPQVVSEYKEGKDQSLKFLVGQGMRISKGAANPSLLQDMLVHKIRS